MTYIQKNNPFKQKTSTVATSDISQSDIDTSKIINKMRFEMGQTYPIVSEEDIVKDEEQRIQKSFYGKNKPRTKAQMKEHGLSYEEWKKKELQENIQGRLGATAQSEQERVELYSQDPSGKGRSYDPGELKTYKKDLEFVKIAKEAGGETFDKLTSLSNKDLVGFQKEVTKIAKPLVGVDLSDVSMTQGIRMVKDIDLSAFKPYLEKADINTGDIKKIINAQIGNMPDENDDGVPDAFEGRLGKLKKFAIDKLIDSKLKDLG